MADKFQLIKPDNFFKDMKIGIKEGNHPLTLTEVLDKLNEQNNRIETLEKFLILKNREINNSIILSDEFKGLWNESLKIFVGDLE